MNLTTRIDSLLPASQTQAVVDHNGIPFDRVLALFHKFAENPGEELYGRCFHHRHPIHEMRYKSFVIGLRDYLNTLCGDTYEGLMKAIFDARYIDEKSLNTMEINDHEAAWQELQILTEKNFQVLMKNTGAHFFTYGFEIGIVNVVSQCSSRLLGGHQFIVIQYLDHDKNVRYLLLQSYVSRYTFQDFLKRKNNDFSHEGFMQFLRSMRTLTSFQTWSQEVIAIYKQYFDVDYQFELNSKLSSRIPLKLQWGVSSAEEVLEADRKFQEIKLLPQFPKIMIFNSDSEEEGTLVRELFHSKNEKVIDPVACDFVVPCLNKVKIVDYSLVKKFMESQKVH